MNIHSLGIGLAKKHQQQLQHSFQGLSDYFSVSFSENVSRAISNVDFSLISFVIIDHSLDAFAKTELTQYLKREEYSSIKLLIITADKSNHHLFTGDIPHQFLDLPITSVSILTKIILSRRKSYKAKQWKGIDLLTTLRLVEMDVLTCSISLSLSDHKNKGWLFFRNGYPVNAECDGITGRTVVTKLLSLETPVIGMYHICPLTENVLKTSCSRIILHSKTFNPESDGRKKNAPAVNPKKINNGLAGLFVKVKARREHCEHIDIKGSSGK